MMAIGLHYGHGLVGVMLECCSPQGVSSGVGLEGGCSHFLVLLAKEN